MNFEYFWIFLNKKNVHLQCSYLDNWTWRKYIRYFGANRQPSSRSVATLRYLQNFFTKLTIKVLCHNLQFNNTASFNDALIFFIFITLYWFFFSSFVTHYLALSSSKLFFGHYFTFISWQSLHFSSVINTCLGYM